MHTTLVNTPSESQQLIKRIQRILRFIHLTLVWTSFIVLSVFCIAALSSAYGDKSLLSVCGYGMCNSIIAGLCSPLVFVLIGEIIYLSKCFQFDTEADIFYVLKCILSIWWLINGMFLILHYIRAINDPPCSLLMNSAEFPQLGEAGFAFGLYLTLAGAHSAFEVLCCAKLH